MVTEETEVKRKKALLQVYVDPDVIADLMRLEENYYRTSGKYISRSVYVEKNIILPHLKAARKEGILK